MRQKEKAMEGNVKREKDIDLPAMGFFRAGRWIKSGQLCGQLPGGVQRSGKIVEEKPKVVLSTCAQPDIQCLTRSFLHEAHGILFKKWVVCETLKA